MSQKLTTKLAIILILTLLLTFVSLGQAKASTVLEYRMQGQQVAVLQQNLTEAGYNPGPVNGFFGYRTKRAVMLFQQDNNLEITGEVGQQTWSLLIDNGSAPDQNIPDQDSDSNSGGSNQVEQDDPNRTGDSSKIVLEYRDRGNQVKELQTRLEKLDHNPGPVNGYYAYMTKRAVKNFQRDNNLAVTGNVDEVTWNLLKSKTGQVDIPNEDNNNNDQNNNGGNDNDRSNDSGDNGSSYYRLSEGDLIRSKTGPKIYVIENGKKRHITSPAVFNALDYNSADVQEVPTSVVNRISTGSPIAMDEAQGSQPTPNNPGQDNDQVTDPQSGQLTAAERQMLNSVNQERSRRGLELLEVDMRLVRLARKKSRDMIENNYFSHHSPTYGLPFDMLRNAGIRYRTAGENLAGNPSVSGAHQALMNSSGHRRNILSSKYTKIGIGVVNGGPYGKMFTQLFMDEF
jgi:uncharacterized YkwD family protein